MEHAGKVEGVSLYPIGNEIGKCLVLTHSKEEKLAGENHVKASAALRGQRRYEEAIAEIENNRDAIDEDILLPALMQAFYAAKEGQIADRVRQYAQEIALHDPDIPSIQGYL